MIKVALVVGLFFILFLGIMLVALGFVAISKIWNDE